MRTGISLAAVVFAFACQPGPADQTKNSPSQSTTMPASETAAVPETPLNAVIPPEADTPTGAATARGPAREVHLIEYQIHMPQTLPAGRVSLNIENGGKEDHALAIEALNQQSVVLKRGDTTAMDVDLKPGTYTVFCPVDGHRAKGMETKVTVK